MKNVIFYFSVLVLAGFYSDLISQDIPPRPPAIEVQGSASIKVVPDIIKWSINVKVDSDNSTQAKNENDRSVKKVLDILKEKGVESKDIQTGGIKITQNIDYYGSKLMKYSVSNDIWFTLNDVSRYDEFTSALIEIDNVFITNTTLEYSKAIEIRKQAREDALLAAKKKAEDMAGVLGQSVGKPILISEEPIYFYNNYALNNVVYDSDATPYGTGMTFREGTISIEARIKVVFELINQ